MSFPVVVKLNQDQLDEIDQNMYRGVAYSEQDISSMYALEIFLTNILTAKTVEFESFACGSMIQLDCNITSHSSKSRVVFTAFYFDGSKDESISLEILADEHEHPNYVLIVDCNNHQVPVICEYVDLTVLPDYENTRREDVSISVTPSAVITDFLTFKKFVTQF
jgi:hypothetical protein